MTIVQSLQLPQHLPQTAPPLAPPTPEHVSPARTMLSVVMVVLGSVVTTLDLQMTNPALSQQIEGSLGFTPDDATWITVCYTSAELIFISLGGWLTDAFSRRRYLSLNLAIFVGFSLACAMSWDLPSIIVFRTFLGLVSGTFTYSSFNMVLTQLPRAKQPLGFVMLLITVGLPIPIGNFLAGWIDEHLGWQYIYYLNMILGLLVMAGIRHWIDPQPMRLSKLKQVDWLGAVVLAISIICMVTALEWGNTDNWFDSEFIVLLSLISVLSFAIFCWIELNQPRPLIDLRILGQRNFAFGNIFSATFGIFLGYTSTTSQYLGQIQGYNPVQISSALIWGSLVNPLAGKILGSVETRLVLGVGTGIFAISCFMNSRLDYNVARDQFIGSQIVRASVQAITGAAISYAATENLKKEQANDASAIYNLIRSTAATMAGAGIGTLITKREQYHSNIIVDSVSIFNHQTQARLQQLSEFFTSKSGDPHAAQSQALQALADTIRQQAYIIAYGDAFYFIGMAAIVGATIALPFFTKIKKPSDVEK